MIEYVSVLSTQPSHLVHAPIHPYIPPLPYSMIVGRISLLEGIFRDADQGLINHSKPKRKERKAFAEMHILLKLCEYVLVEVVGMREESVEPADDGV
jgi:hypothetical protein